MIALILARTTSSRTEVLRHMRSQFGESDPDLWWKIPFVLTLLIIALLLVFVLARIDRRRNQQLVKPQPMKLYLSSLIKLHFPWRDILQLWRLARALQLDHPTVLLISPAKYDESVSQYCAAGRLSRVGTQRRFLAIRHKLFDSGPMSTAS